MIYTANPNSRYGGCWIRVVRFGDHFRAATNDQDAHILIDSLDYQDNRADAQADLDKLAGKHGWHCIRKETNRA